MKAVFIILLPLIIFSNECTYAQQITLKTQLRIHTELRNGYRIPATTNSIPSFFTSQRTRILLDYTNEKLSIHISPQDVRVWGDEIQNIDNPSFALHEAYARIQIWKNISITAGRQELVYDDHRLLGNSDWTQTAKSHDVLLFQFNKNRWKIDLAAAYNQLSENNFASVYTIANYQSLFV